ncbi:MAG: urease subunit beta [Ferruginibacter sp.]
MIPGEYFLRGEPVECNAGKEAISITVVNTGDRPVQVGSHFHFFEVNRQLLFDREKALGRRLNIAAGTAVRFEPGEEKKVALIEIGGKKLITGFNDLVNGSLEQDTVRATAVKNIAVKDFKNNAS